MNAKVQETIENIKSGKECWPHYFRIDDDEKKAAVFGKHSKLEWVFIYKECAKFGGKFWADLRVISYEDKDWYTECYRSQELKKGCYPYIPFEPTQFYKKISKLQSRFNLKSFLDVGAGYGDKVLIAREIFEIANGIEYVEEYVKVAKTFSVDLINADAFEFKGFKDYDLLYIFHPIHDEELYRKFVIHLLQEMKVGGYLLEVYDPYREFISTVEENKDKFNIRIISRSRYGDGVLIKKKVK